MAERRSDHQHVLRLANAGALDFALAEYTRLGLDQVRDDEDVMALKGRLFKDLHASRQGGPGESFARLSADAYEAAHAATGGYFSGINAATMALLSEAEPDEVERRARRVLLLLPDTADLAPSELYFVEATRAEALLLLGDTERAATALRTAREHDPLNYTAHASTLRQFQRIAAYRSLHLPWLDQLQPPLAAHFCGPLFEADGERAALDEVAEWLRQADIAFGYGALAAGADIVFAEALLAEGAELHVRLPVEAGRFEDASVRPFGAAWQTRFRTCLDGAHSVEIIADGQDWHDADVDGCAALAAMGDAVRCGDRLASGSVQLRARRPDAFGRATARSAAWWSAGGRDAHALTFTTDGTMSLGEDDSPPGRQPNITLRIESEDGTCADSDIDGLPEKLQEVRAGENVAGRTWITARLGELRTTDPDAVRHAVLALPHGGIYADRLAADAISLFLPGTLRASAVEDPGGGHPVLFSVRALAARSA